MTTPLTPERLAQLEESFRSKRITADVRVAPGNYEVLLSMARRLLELEGAGEYLAQSDRRVTLVVDYRAPGETTFDCRARCLPQVAEMLGWKP